MNKAEMSWALAIAKSDADVSAADIAVMDGFGLADFQPVHVSVGQVARLIRWQCQRFDGKMDGVNLDEIATLGRKAFIILHDVCPLCGGEPERMGKGDTGAELLRCKRCANVYEHVL